MRRCFNVHWFGKGQGSQCMELKQFVKDRGVLGCWCHGLLYQAQKWDPFWQPMYLLRDVSKDL